ncbi:hypothetical protein ACFX13_037066 [Malus domestica]
MSPFPRNVILLVLVLVITSKTTNAAYSVDDDIFRTRHIKVTIINTLESAVDLKVHCKSKNDDLGVHVIRPKESYDFEFGVKIFWTKTLFFCGFTWSDKFRWFDIYKQDRDNCKNCIWKVHQNGPCLNGGPCYPWNKDLAA